MTDTRETITQFRALSIATERLAMLDRPRNLEQLVVPYNPVRLALYSREIPEASAELLVSFEPDHGNSGELHLKVGIQLSGYRLVSGSRTAAYAQDLSRILTFLSSAARVIEGAFAPFKVVL